MSLIDKWWWRRLVKKRDQIRLNKWIWNTLLEDPEGYSNLEEILFNQLPSKAKKDLLPLRISNEIKKKRMRIVPIWEKGKINPVAFKYENVLVNMKGKSSPWEQAKTWSEAKAPERNVLTLLEKLLSQTSQLFGLRRSLKKK